MYAPTHRSAASLVAPPYEEATAWLLRCGLRTEPEKMEFISFRLRSPKRQRFLGVPVEALGLRDAILGQLTIPFSPTVRYLDHP